MSIHVAMTEAALLNAVTHCATLFQWRVYHTRFSIGSQRGFPDLVLCRPPRVLLVELKGERGRLTEQQREWLAALRQCPGVETYVWRPGDWLGRAADGMSPIERALR